MKFTWNWLQDHLETSVDPTAIAEGLTRIGLEVESLHNPAESLQGFRVAQILKAEQHPNADRLRVCSVHDGHNTLQVVCGAPNAREGLRVVLAYPGTKIPASGLVLSKGQIRGVESMGMMCSSTELNLGTDSEGIIELDAQAPVGADFADYRGLNDPVFEISLTPNRGDCFGVRGIARDLAAAGFGTLKPLDTQSHKAQFASKVRVYRDVGDDLCPLFVARQFRSVRNGQSPMWMQNRLRAIGANVISALVDISNYVMFDLGRPNHIFDASRISGDIHVRMAQNNEHLIALKEVEYKLDTSMVVIADEEQALSIAGIKGGLASACTEATSDILWEAAVFDPLSIAQTGRKLNLHSDARTRFERGVDREMVLPATEYATKLILEICGGEVSDIVVSGASDAPRRDVYVRSARIHALTGMIIDEHHVGNILGNLGFSCTKNPGGYHCVVPSWRHDIEREEDLIEEVARIHGYEHLPLTPLPDIDYPQQTESTLYGDVGFSLRRLALGLGYHELQTWSFISSQKHVRVRYNPVNYVEDIGFGPTVDALRIHNPISADLDHMRTSILPNMLEVMHNNRNRGVQSQAFFEMGTQFRGTKPDEQEIALAAIRVGSLEDPDWRDSSPEAADVFHAKADLFAMLRERGLDPDKLSLSRQTPEYFHPHRSGAVHMGPKVILGYFGELHPVLAARYRLKGRVSAWELFVSRLPKPKRSSTPQAYKVSEYQVTRRDFAFVLDQNTAAQDVVRTIKKIDENLIQDVTVFDVYTGEKLSPEQKSLALAVKIQAMDRTLSDEELQNLSTAIINAVQDKHQGHIRQ